MLDDLAAALDGQQLGPRLLIDLLRVPHPWEVGAEHPQDRRAVLRVVAFDPGVARRGMGAVRGHVDGQHMAAALSVDELSQSPYLQLVTRVDRDVRRLSLRVLVLRPGSDRSGAICAIPRPVRSSLPAGALSRAAWQRRGFLA